MRHKVAIRPVADGDRWVRSALAEFAQVPGVRRAGLALAEGGGRRLLFCASDRDNEPRVDWCEIDAYDHVPLNHSVRTGEKVVGSLADLAERYPAFTDRQDATIRALASFPIIAAGHIQGGYVLFYDAPQLFDRPQLTELDDLGGRLGTGLRRVQRTTAYARGSLGDQSVPQGALAATYSVSADPRAVAAARRFLLGTLAAWGIDGDTISTATLCLSELVTNAMIHTDAGCELRVVLDRGVLTTTVRDGARAPSSTSAASLWIRWPCMVGDFKSWTRSRRGGVRSWTPSGRPCGSSSSRRDHRRYGMVSRGTTVRAAAAAGPQRPSQ